jgi:hypothetical protein
VRDDVPADTAMAVYATVSAALTAAPPAAVVQVEVAEDVGRLTVCVAPTSGVLETGSAALAGASDRVGALGGRFAVEGGGTRLVAVVPCAW